MLTLNAPKPEKIKTATEFLEENATTTVLARDKKFSEMLLAGHVPDRLRRFVPISLTFIDKGGDEHVLDINVTYDYLSIGDDNDQLYAHMSPLEAQKVADAWECMLPTTKLVEIIWQNASVKVDPQPWGPPYDASMQSTDRIVAHDVRVRGSQSKKGFVAEVPQGCSELPESPLLAGHKKDVVITNQLLQKPRQVAIFGWHQANGKPIQPLYLGHESTYVDYSQCIRLVSKTCTLDGMLDNLGRILQDPTLCVAASSEGALTLLRQPLT